MKPVDLTPSRAAGEAVTASTGPSAQVIGLGVAGTLLVVVVAAYFAMARVNTIKEETTAATQAAAEAKTTDQQVQSQIRELGQKPTKESWKQVADSVKQNVISQTTSRADFTLLTRDLRLILPNAQTGFSKVTAGSDPDAQFSSGSSGPPTTITIEGIAPDVESINTLLSNINSTETMEGATIASITRTKVRGHKADYRKFKITATLSIGGGDGGDASGGTGGTTTVSGGGVSDLALDPQPPSPKKVAAQKNAPPPDPLAGLLNDTVDLGGGS